MSPVSVSVAATGLPTFWPEAVFSATLRAPVSVAGNTGALLETAADVSQTESTGTLLQDCPEPTHRYSVPPLVAALRSYCLTFERCNVQSEAALPGALVKPRTRVVPATWMLSIV